MLTPKHANTHLQCVAEGVLTYLYGKSFVAETDHKLQAEALQHSLPRLQRMHLRRQPLDVTIKCQPAKETQTTGKRFAGKVVK